MNKQITWKIALILTLTIGLTPVALAHNPSLAGNRIIETGCIIILWIVGGVVLWKKSKPKDSSSASTEVRLTRFLYFVIPIFLVVVFHEPLIYWVLNI